MTVLGASSLSLTSKYQVISERRVLDLESEVLGTILAERNILLLEYFLFSHSNG